MVKTIHEIIQDVQENHHQIIDDWCKAYLAELYENGEFLRPSMFTLCETDFHEENGKLVKTYYVRPKNEAEKVVYSGWQPIEIEPNNHYCKSSCGDWICKTDKNTGRGLILSDYRGVWENVVVCPFCGEKADD